MYAKIFTSLYQGTLRGNSHGILVFTNLLAHADRDGLVDIHPRAIAEEVGLTREQVQVAIDDLESPDVESRSPEKDGRRITRLDEHRAWGWLVVNYAKYRAIRSEDDRREQNRISQANWRAKKADSKQSKPASATVSLEREESAQADVEGEVEGEATTPKTKTARKRAAPSVLVSLPDLVADGVDEQHATDWLVARKAKGLPLTPTAWADIKAEAVKAKLTTADAIKAAAGNGWAGFKASWMDEKPRNVNYQSTYELKAADAAKWIKGTSLDRAATFDLEIIDAITPQIR